MRRSSANRYGAKYTLAISCLMLSFILLASAMDEASREVQNLKKLEQDRNKAKQRKDSVVAREKSVLSDLKELDKALATREKELRIYERNLTRCEREIKQLKVDLAGAELRLQQTQSLMVKRLKAMYKLGYQGNQLSYMKLLLGAESISDLTSKYKYMSAIAAGDRELLDKAVETKAEIEQKKGQLEERKDRILSFKTEAERTRGAILDKRQKRYSTLAELRESKEDLSKTLAELEIAVRQKESLIARLRNNSTSFENIDDLGRQRGNLPWPVMGKVVANVTSSMPGVTIQAEYGADIRCVAGGKVEYAQWFDGVGFGQMVIIDHGNSYRTLYAHASELLVEKGQRVKAGEVIARVGDTGSLKGAVLYFEIWQGTKAMLTRQWLR